MPSCRTHLYKKLLIQGCCCMVARTHNWFKSYLNKNAGRYRRVWATMSTTLIESFVSHLCYGRHYLHDKHALKSPFAYKYVAKFENSVDHYHRTASPRQCMYFLGTWKGLGNKSTGPQSWNSNISNYTCIRYWASSNVCTPSSHKKVV